MDDLRLYRAPLKDSDIAAQVPAPLSITKIVRAPSGASVTLTIASKPNHTYAVDYSTDLNASGQPGGWTKLTEALPSGGAETTYVDVTASKLSRAFYRVRDLTP
jgi:uncharacterized protein RhaS with RHS repeats